MLIDLLILVLVLGLIVWIVNQFLPEPFRKIALVICVVVLVIWLLQYLRVLRPLALQVYWLW